MTKLLACWALLALVSLGSTAAQEPAKEPKKPALPEFNRYVMNVAQSYPADGTHRYWWPRGKEGRGWGGNVRDLFYEGKLVAKGDKKGRAFCCGLTFEVFVQAWQKLCAVYGKPARLPKVDGKQDFLELRGSWFGNDGNRKTHMRTIVEYGLGRRIRDLEEARAGDFLQLWRQNGSGHSVIFLSWVREKKRIIGVRYWSTQKSTQGIGERVEFFAKGAKDKRGVDPKQLYLARVEVPKGWKKPGSGKNAGS
jgi:hypothetical protein